MIIQEPKAFEPRSSVVGYSPRLTNGGNYSLPMKIAISGKAGSGKSTVAKRLAEQLGIPRISFGNIFRWIIKGRSESSYDAVQKLDDDPSIDLFLDLLCAQYMNDKNNYVLEGRMVGVVGNHLRQGDNSLITTIFLRCEEVVRSSRLQERDGKEPFGGDLDEVLIRDEMDKKRCFNLYGVDIYNPSQCEIVVDTTFTTPDKVCEEILDRINYSRTINGGNKNGH